MTAEQVADLLAQLDDLADGMEEIVCSVAIVQFGDGGIETHATTDVPVAVVPIMARGLAQLLRGEGFTLSPADALDIIPTLGAA